MAPRPHSILPPWLLGESTARISMEGSLSNLDLGQRISFEQQPSAWKLHKCWTVLIGCLFHAIILCQHLECAVLPDFCTAISWQLQDVSHFFVSHFSQILSGLTIQSFHRTQVRSSACLVLKLRPQVMKIPTEKFTSQELGGPLVISWQLGFCWLLIIL